MTKNCFEDEILPKGVQGCEGTKDASGELWKCWATGLEYNTSVSIACNRPNSNFIGLCKNHYKEIIGK